MLKKLFAVCMALIMVFMFAGCEDLIRNLEQYASGLMSSEEEIEYTEDYYDRLFFGDTISDEILRENIFSALVSINMNTEFIKEFQKTVDETGTEKYSFIYRENPFIVTIGPDSAVESVRVGEDGADVYLKGYESYNVDDYITTDSMVKGLSYMDINVVEVYFDYPEIYEFADDWSCRHEGMFYYVGGTVLIGEAKEEHSLDIVYYYEEAENTMHWYQIFIDGTEKTSFQKVYEDPVIEERKPLPGE